MSLLELKKNLEKNLNSNKKISLYIRNLYCPHLINVFSLHTINIVNSLPAHTNSNSYCVVRCSTWDQVHLTEKILWS